MKKLLFAVLCLSTLLPGCGYNEGEKIGTVTWANLPKQNHEGVSITGYLHLPYNVNDGGAMDILLLERPAQKAGLVIITKLPQDTGVFSIVKLKKGYSSADFKLKIDNGEIIAGEGAYVKITGDFDTTELRNNVITLTNITKIEKLAPVKIDYAELNVPILTKESADTLYDRLVTFETSFKGDMYMDKDRATYYLNDTPIDLIACLHVGNEKNQVEYVKAEYFVEHAKVKDNKGKIIPEGKKIRVYGVLTATTDSGPLVLIEEIVQ